MASFRDGTRYLAIADHLRGSQMTMSVLARSMGLKTGDIYRHVLNMVEAELLASGGPEGRGTEYWVPEERLDQLDYELAEAQPRWEIVAGQFGVHINAIADLRATAALLADPTWTSTVLWALETNSPGEGYLLVLAREATAAAVGGMRASLEAVGCECRTLRFGERFSAEGLRALATAWQDAGDAGGAPR